MPLGSYAGPTLFAGQILGPSIREKKSAEGTWSSHLSQVSKSPTSKVTRVSYSINSK